jgi:hypothetical protein
MAISLTDQLNQLQALKDVSLVPLGFKRIILFDVNQLYVEKSHQTIIFPSLCFAKV